MDDGKSQADRDGVAHTDHNQVSLHHQHSTDGANWASYATDQTMVGFASVSGADDGRPPWMQDHGHATSRGFVGLTTTGQDSFGHQGERSGSFISPAALLRPFRERTLKDLYQDYPDKELRGIKRETVQFAASIIRHITKDAAHAWIQEWAPSMEKHTPPLSMSQVLEKHSVAAEKKTSAAETSSTHVEVERPSHQGRAGQYFIPVQALNLKYDISAVIHLFRRCIIEPIRPSPTELHYLIYALGQYIKLCRVLRDHKRAIFLGRTKKRIERIRACLDREKSAAHAAAALRLRQINREYRMRRAQEGDWNPIMALESPAVDDAQRSLEKELLDRVASWFERYRSGAETAVLDAIDILQRKTFSPAERERYISSLPPR